MNPQTQAVSSKPPGHGRASRTRYKVLAFAVCLAAITYLDRICISISAPLIMRDLSLSQVQMSLVFSAFTLAYGIFEIPTGWWGDRVGTRRVLTRIVAWWSAFTMATAAAFNYAALLAVRFLFGVGEAGCFPNVARTFSRWFPVTERGTAQGVFFMGAHLGGGLTPLLVVAMLAHFHWRTVFVIFGAVGILWAAAWYRWFRDEPSQHEAVNAAELHHITAGRSAAAGHIHGGTRWNRLLTSPNILALCAMYFTQSYGFYFYITWLPAYLEKQRGFTGTTLGVLAGLPLTLSVIADLFGGLATDRATRRFGLRVGRCGVGGAALLAAAGFAAAGAATGNNYAAAILISLAGASGNFLLSAAWGVSVDIAGGHAGTVSASMNTAGQVGGFLSPIVLAVLVRYGAGWSAPLYVMAALYLLGAACWWFIDPRQPVFEDIVPARG